MQRDTVPVALGVVAVDLELFAVAAAAAVVQEAAVGIDPAAQKWLTRHLMLPAVARMAEVPEPAAAVWTAAAVAAVSLLIQG